MKTEKSPEQRSLIQWLLTIVGTTGIAALFLPFASNASPFYTVFEEDFFDLWKLGLPAFLSLFVFAASLRWLLTGFFSRIERVAFYVLSAAAVSLTIVWFVSALLSGDAEPDSIHEWIFLTVVPVTVLLGVLMLIRTRKLLRSISYGPVMAMQLAYLPNAILCLVSFFGDLQIGAYGVLTTVVVYIAQPLLVCWNARRAEREEIESGRTISEWKRWPDPPSS